ncbi:MAG: hypothetical protein Q8Q88_02995 [Phenylobacterium sp.]|uniref:hypothetical protein n=1 Tax=Phenylobacterium sp. TaxID=1871053 RepID=UPI00273470AC|nr:hypothetical protein [Phenylobacterium sp.]MDP3745995.1 hypothetical protein [Phenylobacterium sp.]
MHIAGDLLRFAGFCVVVLGPVAFWLWRRRPQEPRVRFAFLLPLTWLTPFAAAMAWTGLSFGESREPLPLILVCLIAQGVFSAALIALLKRARPAAIAWALVNIPFGLVFAFASGMTFTGEYI